ncbi:hypothetical protein Btru_067511 [Bulinus truncatus]|nr:hypothetical protein Btru_067511 [Bulinus truncatus]
MFVTMAARPATSEGLQGKPIHTPHTPPTTTLLTVSRDRREALEVSRLNSYSFSIHRYSKRSVVVVGRRYYKQDPALGQPLTSYNRKAPLETFNKHEKVNIKCSPMLRSMKRFSAPALSVYPDPTRPPDDDSDASLSDGSKKVKTTQSFEPLFNSESLSDIVLDVNHGEAVFHAHKTIVGLKSERLAALITNLATAPADNSSKPVLHLQEDPECSAVFSRFLYFIYSGAVWLHRDYVVPLFKLSVKYGVNALANHCENYILQLLNKCLAVDVNCPNPPPTLSAVTVCDLYEEDVYREETRRTAFAALARRFADLIHTERWVACAWLTVRDLIRSDECLCEENLILVAATDWMKRNKLQDKVRIQEILSSIRYPRLPRRVLYHLYTAASFKNFPQVQDLIEAAIRYHCFKDVPEAQDEFTGLQYRARGKGRTRHTVCGGENLNAQESQHPPPSAWQWDEAGPPDSNYSHGQHHDNCDNVADLSRSDEVNDNHHSQQHAFTAAVCRGQRQGNQRMASVSPVATVQTSERDICGSTTDIALQINIHSHGQM